MIGGNASSTLIASAFSVLKVPGLNVGQVRLELHHLNPCRQADTSAESTEKMTDNAKPVVPGSCS